MKIQVFLLFLFPMVVGAEPLFYLHPTSVWTLEVIEGAKTYNVINKVDEVRVVNGQNWYRLEEYGELFWVSNNESGQVEAINFFDGNPEENAEPEIELIYKYPAVKGEQWETFGATNTYLGREKFKVPAGEFECHSYYIDMGDGNYSKSCIANDVGVVYNESILNNGEKTISRLVKYQR